MSDASFDYELLKDWQDTCEGRANFDEYHFSTLLMEVFLDGYTDELDHFLKEVTKYFDQSIYERLKFTFSHDVPPIGSVEEAVGKDLSEMRKLLIKDKDATEIVELIDNKAYKIVHDRDLLYKARESDNHAIFGDVVSDYFIYQSADIPHMHALEEMFYHIATEYELMRALTSKANKLEVDFSNYLEIYRRGSQYIFDDDEILIYIYQKKQA